MTLHTLQCSWSFKPTMLAYALRFAAMCSVLYSISFSVLAQVILSAERDSPAVRDFAVELAQTLPGQNIIYMPRTQLEQQQHFAADTQLILLGPELLDWRLQLKHSNPHTLMMQVSRVQAHQRIGQQQPPRLTFLWSDPPIKRQIALLKATQPGVRHVGVLFSLDSAFLLPEVMQALQAADMLMHVYNWSGDYIARGFHYLLNTTEVLLGLDDGKIYNPSTIKNILLSSYARKKALVGPTAAFINAGSLASTYSNKDNWLSTLRDLLQTPAEQWPRSLYPNAFEVMVNQQVARSLGIQSISAAEVNQSMQQYRFTP